MGSGAGAAADGIERWTGPQQPLRCFALQIWGDGAAAVRSSRRTGAVADSVARADWGGGGWRCTGRRVFQLVCLVGGLRMSQTIVGFVFDTSCWTTSLLARDFNPLIFQDPGRLGRRNRYSFLSSNGHCEATENCYSTIFKMCLRPYAILDFAFARMPLLNNAACQNNIWPSCYI
uniref:Uncharacterized protein n=1 Tax=Oryza brachyantha TaxID=4533 RepID=J3LC82_ORYBR